MLAGLAAILALPPTSRGQERLALGSARQAALDGEDAAPDAAQGEGLEELPRIESERALRRYVRGWPNMRLGHPFEVWSWDPDVAPRLRPKAECLQSLRSAGIRFHADEPSSLVPFGVKVERIPGLSFDGRDLVVSCEMAARLPRLAALLRDHGVVGMTVMSAWRPGTTASFHTLGLALDVARFRTAEGETLDVEDHYAKVESAETCATLAPEGKARRLQAIACSLFANRAFSTVLTPNYNHGHRHHFHVDMRPGDERFYLR